METRGICRPAYTKSGNSPEVRYAPETYNATWKKGAVVTVSASGRLIPLRGHISMSWLGAGRMQCGIAAEDGHGRSYLSASLAPYYPSNEDTVFIANVQGVAAATSTIGITAIGTVANASLRILGSGTTLFVSPPRGVNMGYATGSVVVILGIENTTNENLIAGGDGSDQYARVYFQFAKVLRN